MPWGLSMYYINEPQFFIMKKLLMTLSAVMMLFGAQAQNVQAGSPSQDKVSAQTRQPMMRMAMMKKMTQQPKKAHQPMECLQLNDEQKAQIKAIRLDCGKKATPVKAQLGIKRAELKALELAEKADMKAINTKIDEIAKLQADLEKISIDGKMKTRVLLNDEQKLKFDMIDHHPGSKIHHPRR